MLLCAGQIVLTPYTHPPGQPQGQRKNECDKKDGALESKETNVIHEGGVGKR